MSSNVSDGHLGFMQIRIVPQSCHSGKRWIWLQEALSNTNPSKKLTVSTISGFTMGHIQLATRLCRPTARYYKSEETARMQSKLFFSNMSSSTPSTLSFAKQHAIDYS